MPQETRPAPFFVGESPALDFLNTVAKPRSEQFEWLATGADLLDWLVAAGLATEAELAHFRRPDCETELEDARMQILGLREQFREFIEDVHGSALTATDHPFVATLNELLRRGPQYWQLMPADTSSREGRGYVKREVHPLGAPVDLIVRLGFSIASLIAEADFRYLRKCEGQGCTLFFLDVSKNHKRRWCSMEVCGNRAKAAAFRKRS
ncbi:CGNR zinc finger domain-containing protein [Donghicola sp. XS_ASV15]|uniref:CGNR zinc finger domain-containing protein n=1 Tax=Donghicola sp. XS_ASV15 TaxID=3241295 RepID=UPI0035133277